MEEKVSCLIFDHTYQETRRLAKCVIRTVALGKLFLNNLVYGFLNKCTHKKTVCESTV